MCEPENPDFADQSMKDGHECKWLCTQHPLLMGIYKISPWGQGTRSMSASVAWLQIVFGWQNFIKSQKSTVNCEINL